MSDLFGRTEAELAALIEHHNRLYWEKGAPEISDVEYDALTRELAALNPEHPLLAKVNAPTVASLGKVVHPRPMLSLDKAYSLEKVLEWAHKYARSAAEPLLVQPKYDGISARWDGAVLSTRGDGFEGENISDKIPLIEAEAPERTGKLLPEELLRGEIVIRNDDFATIYRHVTRKNGGTYKNSRNAVAGLMALKDLSDVLRQGAKLTLVDYRRISFPCKLSELSEYWPELLEKIEALPYPTDGVVIKFADAAFADGLGSTAHHPRGAIAFKFTNIRRPSILRNVVWSFGKNCLTPVAEVDPVEIGGVTIRHATLHNVQNILDKDIQINDVVQIERAGDVIPYIVSAEPMPGRKPALIDRCPGCGALLVRRGPELCCENPDCTETRLQRLLAAVRNIGIERLGEPTLRKMMTQLGVRTLKDVFQLTLMQILTLDKFQAKSAENLLSEIAKARKVEDYRLLAALNVPHVGPNIARLILSAKPLAELRKATASELEDIAGIGPERAAALVRVLAEQNDFIEEMLEAVEIVPTALVGGADAEARPTICFTGKMPEKRSFYENLAAERGYRAVDAVTRELTLLVAMDPAASGGKLNKARDYGVQIMGLAEFLAAPAIPVTPADVPPEPENSSAGESAAKPERPSAEEASAEPEKTPADELPTEPEQLQLGF